MRQRYPTLQIRANLNMEILLGSANGADILWGILIEIPGDAAMPPAGGMGMGCKFDSICGQLVVNIAHTTCVRSKSKATKSTKEKTQRKSKANKNQMTESFANVLQHATEINTRNWPESTVGHEAGKVNTKKKQQRKKS